MSQNISVVYQLQVDKVHQLRSSNALASLWPFISNLHVIGKL